MDPEADSKAGSGLNRDFLQHWGSRQMNRCALAHIEIDSVGGEAQIITGGVNWRQRCCRLVTGGVELIKVTLFTEEAAGNAKLGRKQQEHKNEKHSRSSNTRRIDHVPLGTD